MYILNNLKEKNRYDRRFFLKMLGWFVRNYSIILKNKKLK
jgi:hypothetical protein